MKFRLNKRKFRKLPKLLLRNRPPRLLKLFRFREKKKWKMGKDNISNVTIESTGTTVATTKVVNVKKKENAKKRDNSSPNIRKNNQKNPKKSRVQILSQK